MLAAMGAAFKLEPDQAMSKNQRDLKELQIQRTALIKDRFFTFRSRQVPVKQKARHRCRAFASRSFD